jgi:hypothetical protein
MTKQDVYQLFGASTAAELARKIGCTRQNIGQWPEILSRKHADSIVGIAERQGIKVPKRLRK